MCCGAAIAISDKWLTETTQYTPTARHRSGGGGERKEKKNARTKKKRGREWRKRNEMRCRYESNQRNVKRRDSHPSCDVSTTPLISNPFPPLSLSPLFPFRLFSLPPSPSPVHQPHTDFSEKRRTRFLQHTPRTRIHHLISFVRTHVA